ncbi:MAG: hypothetical protein RI894_569 [Bacteroidota bacterium]
MKKQLILAALLLWGASSFAQIAAGTKYIGGMLRFNSNNNTSQIGSTTVKTPSTSSFSGSPELGYFVIDNLAVGISLDLSSGATTFYKADGSEDSKHLDSGVGVTLYSRKFFNVSENVSLFGGLNLGYHGNASKQNDGTTTTDYSSASTFGASIDAGVAFNITPKITVVGKWAGLGFNSMTTTYPKYSQTGQDKVDKSDSFGVGINTIGNPFAVGIYFGF